MGFLSWVKGLFTDDEEKSVEQPTQTTQSNASIGQAKPIDLSQFEVPDYVYNKPTVELGKSNINSGTESNASVLGISTVKTQPKETSLFSDIYSSIKEKYIESGERMREAGIKRQEASLYRQEKLFNIQEVSDYVNAKTKGEKVLRGELLNKVIEKDPYLKENYGGFLGKQKLVSDYKGYSLKLGEIEESYGTVISEIDDRGALRQKYEDLGIDIPSTSSHIWHSFLADASGALKRTGTGLKILGEKAERNLKDEDANDIFGFLKNIHNYGAVTLGNVGENMEEYYGLIENTEQMKQIPDELLGVKGYIGGNVASVVGSAAPNLVTAIGTGGTGSVIEAYLEGSGDLYTTAEAIYANRLGKSKEKLTDEEKDLLLKASSEAGVFVAGTTYLSNKIGLEKTLAPFKKQILKESLETGLKEAEEKIVQKSLTGTFTKNYLKSVTSETLEEVSQEAANNIIIKINDIDPNQKINENLLQTALQTAIGVGLSFGLIEASKATFEVNTENKKKSLSALPEKSISIPSGEGNIISIEDTENNEVTLKEISPSVFEKDNKLDEDFSNKKIADVTLKLADIVGGEDARKYQNEFDGQIFESYDEFVKKSTKRVSEIISSKEQLKSVASQMANVIIGDSKKVYVTSVKPIEAYNPNINLTETYLHSDKDNVKFIADNRYTQPTETNLARTISTIESTKVTKPKQSETPKKYKNVAQEVFKKEYNSANTVTAEQKPEYLTQMSKQKDITDFEVKNVNKALANEAYDKLSVDVNLTGKTEIDKLAINKIQKDLAAIAKNEISTREVALMNAEIKSLKSRIEQIQETTNGILNKEVLNMKATQKQFNGKNINDAPQWYGKFYRENERNATDEEMLELADKELERKANDPINDYLDAQDYISLKQSEKILQGLVESYEISLEKNDNRVGRYMILSNSLNAIKKVNREIRLETNNRKEIKALEIQRLVLEKEQGKEIYSAFRKLTGADRELYKTNTEAFVNSYKDPYLIKKVTKNKLGEKKTTYRFSEGSQVDTLNKGESIYKRLIDLAQDKGYENVKDYFIEITNRDKQIISLRNQKRARVNTILQLNEDYTRLMRQQQSVKNQMDVIVASYKDPNDLIKAVRLQQLKQARTFIKSQAKRDLANLKRKNKNIELKSKLNIRIIRNYKNWYNQQFPALRSITEQFTDKFLIKQAGKVIDVSMTIEEIEKEFADKLDPYIEQQLEIVELVDQVNRYRRSKDLKNIAEFNKAIGMPFLPEKDQLTTRDFKKLTKDKLQRYYEVLQQLRAGETFVKESQIKYLAKDWFNLPESRETFNNRMNNALNKGVEVKLFSRNENGNFEFNQIIDKENIPDFESFNDPRIQIGKDTKRIPYPLEEGTFNPEDVKRMLITNNAFFDYFRNKAIQDKVGSFKNKINTAIRDGKKVSVYSIDENGKENFVKKLTDRTKLPDFFDLITETITESKDKNGNIVEIVKENIPFVKIGKNKLEMPRRQSRSGVERLFKNKYNTGIKFLDRMLGASQLSEIDSVYDVVVTEFLRIAKKIENVNINFEREYTQKYKAALKSRKSHDVLDRKISTNNLGNIYASESDLNKKKEILSGATDLEKKFFQENEAKYLEAKNYIATVDEANVRKYYGKPMIPARLSDIISQNKTKPIALIKALRDWSNQKESIEESTFAKSFQDSFKGSNVSSSDVFNFAKKRTGLVDVVSNDYNYVNLRYFKEYNEHRILNEEMPLIKSLIDFASSTFDSRNPKTELQFKEFYKDHFDMLKGINPQLRDAKTNTLKNISAINNFFTSTALMFKYGTQVTNIVGQLSTQFSNNPIAFLRGLGNTLLLSTNMITERFGYKGKIAENISKILRENPSLIGGKGWIEELGSLDKDIFSKANLAKWIGYAVNTQVDNTFYSISYLNETERNTGEISEERVAEILKKKGQITQEDTSKIGGSPWNKLFTALSGWRNTELMRTVNTARLTSKLFTETFDKIKNKEYDDAKTFFKDKGAQLIGRYSGFMFEVGLTYLRYQILEYLLSKAILPEDEDDDNYIEGRIRQTFREANSRIGAIVSIGYQAMDILKETRVLAGKGKDDEAFAYIKDNEQIFQKMFYAFGMRGYDKTNNGTILGDQFFITDRILDIYSASIDMSTLFNKDSLSIEKEKAKVSLAKELNKTTYFFGSEIATESREQINLSKDLFGDPFKMIDEDNQKAYEIYKNTKDYSYEQKLSVIKVLESDKDNKDNIKLAKGLKIMYANESFTKSEKEFLSNMNKKVAGEFATPQTQGTQLYLYMQRNNFSEEEERDFLQRFAKNYIMLGIVDEQSLNTYSFLESNNVELSTKELKFYNIWKDNRGKEIANHIKSLQNSKDGLSKDEEDALIRTYVITGIIPNENVYNDYILEMGLDSEINQ